MPREDNLRGGVPPRCCQAEDPPTTDFDLTPLGSGVFSFLSGCSKEGFRHGGLLGPLCPLSLSSETSTSVEPPHSVGVPLLARGQRLEVRGGGQRSESFGGTAAAFSKSGLFGAFRGPCDCFHTGFLSSFIIM